MPYASFVNCKGSSGRAIISSSIGTYETTVNLVDGDDAFLPNLQDGEWYYAFLNSPCGDCEQVKVTATPAPDKLTIVRISTNPKCFPSGSTIRYDNESNLALNAIIGGVVRTAASPLMIQDGKISLNLDYLKNYLTGMLIDANAPLHFDIQSGVLSLDVDRVYEQLNKRLLKSLNATSPITFNSDTGTIGLDVTALKSSLGIQ